MEIKIQAIHFEATEKLEKFILYMLLSQSPKSQCESSDYLSLKVVLEFC